MSLDAKQVTGASSDDQGSGINHWLRLSDEMALYILCHLPQKSLKTVSLVNKKFRDLSRDDSLWTELTLDYEDIKNKTESCRKLVERCKKLASLKISNQSYNEKTLNIMTVVIRAKESLKSLEVDSSMTTWSPAAMTKLGQLQNLTSLTMDFSPEARYEGAKKLEELAKLDKLEVLNLGISHNFLGHLDDWIQSRTNSLTSMKSVFQTLKKLKNVKISLPHSDFDESLVSTLATNNPDLTGLRFMNYPSLSEETVDLLADSCLGLQELTIRFSHSDSKAVDEQLMNLVKKVRQLERLDVFCQNVTDGGIERMVGAAKNLKYLRVICYAWARVSYDVAERLRMKYQHLDLRINCM